MPRAAHWPAPLLPATHRSALVTPPAGLDPAAALRQLGFQVAPEGETLHLGLDGRPLALACPLAVAGAPGLRLRAEQAGLRWSLLWDDQTWWLLDQRRSLGLRCAARWRRATGLPSAAAFRPGGELAAAVDAGAVDAADAGHAGAAYEAQLGAPRRRQGAYYTPPHLVAELVEATLAPCWQLGHALRVLDPAAGAGVFLAEAGLRLAERLTCPGADLWRAAAAARLAAAGCVTGVDLDPGAVTLATRLLATAFGSPAAVQQGNGLDHRGKYHAVVGNPPYLSVKRGHLDPGRAADLRARFRLARGQWDSYMLFVEHGLSLLAPGGRLGLVVPKQALTNAHTAPLRVLVHESGSIVEVIDHGAAFGAAVETVGLVIERGAQLPVLRLCRAGGLATVPVARWRSRPHLPLSPNLRPEDPALLDQIEAAPLRLSDVAHVTRGLELGKRHPALHDRPRPGIVPLLRGEDVDAWSTYPGAWVDPAGLTPSERKDDLFAPGPKLVVRRVAAVPRAARMPDGVWALNTLYVVRPHDPADLAWLLAVLNSTVAAFWLTHGCGSDDRLFPYLRQSQLLALPLPPPQAVADGPHDARVAAAYGVSEASLPATCCNGSHLSSTRRNSSGISGLLM